MFAIETFCGTKYGGWAGGRDRFSTREAADRQVQAYHRDEKAASATPMKRRTVGSA